MDKVVYISLAINGMLCCVVIKDLVENKVFSIVVSVICDSVESNYKEYHTYLILRSSKTARFSLL